MHKFIATIFLLLFSAAQLSAQQLSSGGTMETNGKIYVVMAVCLTVLAGILFYLISLDRKISNIEKKKD
jgi:hypothetical protein